MTQIQWCSKKGRIRFNANSYGYFITSKSLFLLASNVNNSYAIANTIQSISSIPGLDFDL